MNYIHSVSFQKLTTPGILVGGAAALAGKVAGISLLTHIGAALCVISLLGKLYARYHASSTPQSSRPPASISLTPPSVPPTTAFPTSLVPSVLTSPSTSVRITTSPKPPSSTLSVITPPPVTEPPQPTSVSASTATTSNPTLSLPVATPLPATESPLPPSVPPTATFSAPPPESSSVPTANAPNPPSSTLSVITPPLVTEPPQPTSVSASTATSSNPTPSLPVATPLPATEPPQPTSVSAVTSSPTPSSPVPTVFSSTPVTELSQPASTPLSPALPSTPPSLVSPNLTPSIQPPSENGTFVFYLAEHETEQFLQLQHRNSSLELRAQKVVSADGKTFRCEFSINGISILNPRPTDSSSRLFIYSFEILKEDALRIITTKKISLNDTMKTHSEDYIDLLETPPIGGSYQVFPKPIQRISAEEAQTKIAVYRAPLTEADGKDFDAADVAAYHPHCGWITCVNTEVAKKHWWTATSAHSFRKEAACWERNVEFSVISTQLPPYTTTLSCTSAPSKGEGDRAIPRNERPRPEFSLRLEINAQKELIPYINDIRARFLPSSILQEDTVARIGAMLDELKIPKVLHNIVIEYHHPFFVPQLAYFAGSYVRFRDKDIQSVRKLPLENQDAKVKLLVEQMKSDAQQENVKRVKAKYATGSAAPATSADH